MRAVAAIMAAARKPNAHDGLSVVQRIPATVLAAKLPRLWIAASRPNAEPRISAGAACATAVCSAVSAPRIITRVLGDLHPSPCRLAPWRALDHSLWSSGSRLTRMRSSVITATAPVVKSSARSSRCSRNLDRWAFTNDWVEGPRAGKVQQLVYYIRD